jgi:hypothetical protein
MKRSLAVAALLSSLIAGSALAAEVHGAWTATLDSDSTDRVHVFMTSGQWHQFGQSFTPSSLGLSASVLQATSSTPVNLKLDRDAGTLTLEGTFKNGDGAGQFTFTPNRSYENALKAIGIDFDLDSDRSKDDQLFSLAVVDVSLAYAQAMKALFPDTSLHDLRRMRAVGVTPEYVRALRSSGVEVSDSHEVTRLRAVNVTPEFVSELANAGYKNLTARQLIRLAAVGVDGKFIRDMSRYRDRK